MTARIWSRATTPQQVSLLLDSRHHRLIDALMRHEQSAAALARQLDEDVRRVHYLLGKFVRAGLASVTREETRAGRPVKYYSIAHNWAVPYELTSAESFLALLDGLMHPLMRRFLQLLIEQVHDKSRWQVRFGVEPGGHTQITVTDEHGQVPAELDTAQALWTGLNLTPEQAAQLNARLADVLRDIQSSRTESPDVRPYTLGLFLVEGKLV